ncbi:hypothetical protein DFS34DRAFT_649926 [Phlyctochytrium arcticum]|nr:hypothetical protein DFS34DRAFT_649926 [Phlyctochytrium arcticum]
MPRNPGSQRRVLRNRTTTSNPACVNTKVCEEVIYLGTASFSDLPGELIESIFTYVADPSKLVKSTASCWTVGKKSWVKCKWLIARFGLENAFQGSLRWTKLLEPDTLDLLLKTVPIVPRYIVQRALTRFQHINKPVLIIPLLSYGLQHYDDLSLCKNDGQYFKEVIPWTAHAHSNSLVTAARLEALDILIKKYRFNINFCKWSIVTGLPLMNTNEGFRTFLTAVTSGNVALVRVLLRYNIATHIERYSPAGSTNINNRVYDMAMFHLFEASAQWEESFFPNEIRSYMTKTVEALILATKHKQDEVMRLLLEHDLDRWHTVDGFEVLKSTLQLAVDDNYTAGINLLVAYMGNYRPPSKSPSALRRALIAACVDNDLKVVKALLKEGASFELTSEDIGIHAGVDPLKHLIATGKELIFQHLIRAVDFSPDKLSELLIYAIDQHSFSIARYLLTNRRQRPIITDRTIRRCIVHGGTTLLPHILKVLLLQSPDKLVPNFSAALRLAEKRHQEERDTEEFVVELNKYRAKIMDKVVAKRNKGKRKASVTFAPVAEILPAYKEDDGTFMLEDHGSSSSSPPNKRRRISTTSRRLNGGNSGT